MLESVSAATDLDLISYLKAIPDARMRRGVRIPAWYLLLVAVLGILRRCQSLRDLEQFAIPATTPYSPRRWALSSGVRSRTPRSAISFFRWMWRHCALQSVTGRSPDRLRSGHYLDPAGQTGAGADLRNLGRHGQERGNHCHGQT